MEDFKVGDRVQVISLDDPDLNNTVAKVGDIYTVQMAGVDLIILKDLKNQSIGSPAYYKKCFRLVDPFQEKVLEALAKLNQTNVQT
ncbi:hypothetical protein CLV58_11924 [Spirosoma oryzae]|uniref:Uncharacterized protein n=1 Tax=Spirosoma oryzae TaxID=1469603 RepID=A0A2T0SKF2_9BACT|nr:hypothetical protein [Spirosoma oryzae]PRY33875.1 hypothetical protein CLV58_11924 [Spirosoma oryzae]